MTYGDFKNLNRRTAVDNVLRDKTFNIAKNLKYDGYQLELALIVYNFFDEKTSSGAIKKEVMQNEEFAKELHKPILEKLRREKKTRFL